MFTPKINIKDISINADKFTVEDITGNSPTDPTGYQQALYLPQNSTQWVKQAFAQYLGSTPSGLVFDPSTDNLLPAAEFQFQLEDGVYIITEYFSVSVSNLEYSVDVTNKILTKTGGSTWIDPLGLFEGVYAIKKGPFTGIADCSTIASLTSTTLTLDTAIPTIVGDDDLTVVYKASKYLLVTSTGTNKMLQEIGDMSLSSFKTGVNCDPTEANKSMEKILIQASAKINFNCGNYAKAHNAAILLNKITQPSNSNCGC